MWVSNLWDKFREVGLACAANIFVSGDFKNTVFRSATGFQQQICGCVVYKSKTIFALINYCLISIIIFTWAATVLPKFQGLLMKYSQVGFGLLNAVFFQVTRKIVGAILQRITYNEFLPEVLGPDIMYKYQLTLADRGRFYGYSSSVDPSIM